VHSARQTVFVRWRGTVTKKKGTNALKNGGGVGEGEAAKEHETKQKTATLQVCNKKRGGGGQKKRKKRLNKK